MHADSRQTEDRYVTLYGGRVEVTSEPDAGSRFTLHLPATPR